MAALTTIAAVVGAAAAIGGTAYSIKHGQDMGKQASDQADAQSAQQDNMMKDAKAKEDADANSGQATQTRDQAKARQNALTAGAQGRDSTILTSPLGIQDSSQGANKSLLGT